MSSFDFAPDWVKRPEEAGQRGTGLRKECEKILNANIACFKVYLEHYFLTIFSLLTIQLNLIKSN